jgi:hypothetical protein
MNENVKIIVLADELKTSMGTFYKGHIFETKDSPKLQASALKGLIEYANPMQVGLFD